MLRVKTSVKPSRIHGLGLFAEEPIARGAVVWTFDAPVDQRFGPGDVARMSAAAKAFLSRYAYCEHGALVLCGDHARFMNHSDAPNCGNDATRTATVALRDIAPGEELTDDYGAMEDPWSEFEGIIESEPVPAPHPVH
ncbi:MULTISPECIES: SET domain-containing protein [Corallococcus]|uniref:SET domain-containing protein n=1 Tax=Corallococcus TaxID=83461 RepID=UPI00117F0A70|nr:MULTISPECIES: SET domain-containing protein [Corallococcus]NBD10704.1 SET domain-containing protein-lysine N-methyltransferase [Corallococcus silvisoli]TSC31837.1 SET domain-containing protein [Corallococcus sp. Z5C101001]